MTRREAAPASGHDDDRILAPAFQRPQRRPASRSERPAPRHAVRRGDGVGEARWRRAAVPADRRRGLSGKVSGEAVKVGAHLSGSLENLVADVDASGMKLNGRAHVEALPFADVPLKSRARHRRSRQSAGVQPERAVRRSRGARRSEARRAGATRSAFVVTRAGVDRQREARFHRQASCSRSSTPARTCGSTRRRKASPTSTCGS